MRPGRTGLLPPGSGLEAPGPSSLEDREALMLISRLAPPEPPSEPPPVPPPGPRDDVMTMLCDHAFNQLETAAD